MDISVFIASLSLFISVLTLVIQYYLQVRLVRSQRSFEMMGKLNDCSIAELSFPDIWNFYNKEYSGESKTNHEFTKLVDMKLSLLEEIFLQYKKYKFSSKSDWLVWRKVLERVVVRPFFPGYWCLLSPYFHDDFAKEVKLVCIENQVDLSFKENK